MDFSPLKPPAAIAAPATSGVHRLERGGYDVEFVSPGPPSNIQTECPICLLVLRDPSLVDCGKHFCKVCIENVRKTSNICPTCKKEGFQTMLNRAHQQYLNEFQVHCPNHKSDGCTWIGQLREVDSHLNLSPTLENRAKGCSFTKVMCMFCSKPHNRCDLESHETTKCPKRPTTCDYCKEYTSQYEDVNINHLPKCGFIPATCLNGCGKTVLRQDMKNHIQQECPLTMISCKFIHVGCQETMPRKLMDTHLRESLTEHMALQITSLGEQNHRLETENSMLREKIAEMAQRLAQLEKAQESLCGHVGLKNSAGYIEVTMSAFERHRKHCQAWFSPPFYTHYRGYKLCLKVEANELATSNSSSHLSLFLLLMRGEFDDDLKWPFTGEVLVQLVDQTGRSEQHHDGLLTMRGGRRVINESRAISGVSKREFIAHRKLQPNYLKNDSLVFRMYPK